MTKNLELILQDVKYIIDNADKLSNPRKYLSKLLEIRDILSQLGIRFYEGIEKKRVPFTEIMGPINLNNITIDGCSIVGNIEIARRLNYYEKDVSNVIDIVCKDQERTIEQKDTIIRYLKMKGYEYEFLPKETYGYIISLNGKIKIIPNLYGIYYYIEVDLSYLKLYITIDTKGDILIKKNGLDYTLYFENFGLFSILYKFLRYNSKDKEDLEEYEKYENKVKGIIDEGFSKEDYNNLRSSLSERDINKIKRNLGKYLKEHPNSVYKRLYEVIEYV